MKKFFMGVCAHGLPFILTGCSKASNEGASISIIYGATAVLSLVLLIGCLCIDQKRDIWFLLLFSSVLVVNIGVWFMEQLSNFNFEFLSISYIISELFLLGLHLMMEENRRLKNLVTEKEQALSEAAAEIFASSAMKEQRTDAGAVTADRVKVFADGLLDLNQTEKVIFDAYISRATTKEIMTSLCIKENTLKFHNKNIYQKLGVSSRKELLELYKQLVADRTSQEAVDVIV